MSLLNIAAIAASLRRVQGEFASINQHLRGQRDWMDDMVVENLLAGYGYVDVLVEWGIDVFAMGNHKYLLELNNIVLCGPDRELRSQYVKHIAATQNRFYEKPGGGIEDLVAWYGAHSGWTVWRLAAGLYVRMLSKPELFIEGNHRTGVLLASYLLLRAGKPPFVLSVENAAAYFDPSSLIQNINKNGLIGIFRLPVISKRFARFLEEQADFNYLCATNPQEITRSSRLEEIPNAPF